MSIIEGGLDDAPEALGQMLIEAVKERNASLVKSLLKRECYWGKYTQQLSDEDREWIHHNAMPEDKQVHRLEEDYG